MDSVVQLAAANMMSAAATFETFPSEFGGGEDGMTWEWIFRPMQDHTGDVIPT